MKITRRQLLWGGTVGGLLGAGAALSSCTPFKVLLEQGAHNPCKTPVPPRLLQHDLLREAINGVNHQACWDIHAHLVGVGDANSGSYVNPNMSSWQHPIQRMQRHFYMNASCVDESKIDQSYIARMVEMLEQMPKGNKLMLLAFDYHVNEEGQEKPDFSTFYIPNEYVATVVKAHPQYFEWIASIHPYRVDAVERLEKAVAQGARAVKWLPPAMGIDPANPRCKAFYRALVKYNIPLLTHGGKEKAVEVAGTQHYGNPLRLRAALDEGVTVIVAHCASLGEDVDIDKGANAGEVPSFELFARLMDSVQYNGKRGGKILGDISALTLFQRVQTGVIQKVLKRQDWHDRLLNGSDYPLPGVFPLISTDLLVDQGLLKLEVAKYVNELRQYHPLLFDFVVKRHLAFEGKKFLPQVFETKNFFIKG